jgi:hypothetical protein
MRLYHGVNDQHEFWESEDHSLILLRNHRERCWSAHRDYAFMWSENTLKQAVERLGCTLDNYKVWRPKQVEKYELEEA